MCTWVGQSGFLDFNILATVQGHIKVQGGREIRNEGEDEGRNVGMLSAFVTLCCIYLHLSHLVQQFVERPPHYWSQK